LYFGFNTNNAKSLPIIEYIIFMPSRDDLRAKAKLSTIIYHRPEGRRKKLNDGILNILLESSFYTGLKPGDKH
jgi:hypothetical protein